MKKKLRRTTKQVSYGIDRCYFGIVPIAIPSTDNEVEIGTVTLSKQFLKECPSVTTISLSKRRELQQTYMEQYKEILKEQFGFIPASGHTSTLMRTLRHLYCDLCKNRRKTVDKWEEIEDTKYLDSFFNLEQGYKDKSDLLLFILRQSCKESIVQTMMASSHKTNQE